MTGIVASFTGRLHRHAELHYSRRGVAVLSFMASVEDHDADDRSRPTWVQVKVLGQRAEQLSSQLPSSSEVLCRGRLTLATCQLDNGDMRSALALTASSVTVLPQSREPLSAARAVGEGGIR